MERKQRIGEDMSADDGKTGTAYGVIDALRGDKRALQLLMNVRDATYPSWNRMVGEDDWWEDQEGAPVPIDESDPRCRECPADDERVLWRFYSLWASKRELEGYLFDGFDDGGEPCCYAMLRESGSLGDYACYRLMSCDGDCD